MPTDKSASCGKRTPVEMSAQRVEPDLACVERFLGLGDLRLVSARLRVGEFSLQFRDGVVQLAHEPLAAGLLLGVGTLPVLFIELAYGGLDPAQAIFDRLDLVAGNLADLVPATLDGCEGFLRFGAIRYREQFLGLGKQLKLLGKVRVEFDTVFRVDLLLGRVQRIPGRLELCP